MKMLILCSVLLSGCTTYDRYKDTARMKIAEGIEHTLDSCVTLKCTDLPVGILEKRYGRNMDAWNSECRPSQLALPNK
jgi:hypothetical protein